jgi:hypothetical protein
MRDEITLDKLSASKHALSWSSCKKRFLIFKHVFIFTIFYTKNNLAAKQRPSKIFLKNLILKYFYEILNPYQTPSAFSIPYDLSFVSKVHLVVSP